MLECKAKTHPSADERKKLAQEAKEVREAHETVMSGDLPGVEADPVPADGSSANLDQGGVDEGQLEHAIRAAVKATSRGDAEEDHNIERAIRASVAELLSAEGEHVSEPEAIDRAVSASVLEASRNRAEPDHSQEKAPPATAGGAPEYGPGGEGAREGEALRASLQQSLEQQRTPSTNLANNYFAAGAAAEADDPHVNPASDGPPGNAGETTGQSTAADPADSPGLRRAIAESLRLHDQRLQDEAQSKRDEEIVLDYIKRQSLAEEEHKKNVTASAGSGS